MNKNTIIALVLSFGILILWTYFNKKSPVPGKIDKISPSFSGLKKITPDYKDGYLKLEWDYAKDESGITYLIYINQETPVKEFNKPFYTRNNSFIINDIDLSKNYYLIVRAKDDSNNQESNNKQIYFKSTAQNSGVNEEIISVSNSVATYYFSTVGGRLKNIVLKDYKTIDKKEQINLLYYEGYDSKQYYPLDCKIFYNSDDYENLKYNDNTYYSCNVINNKVIFSAIINQNLQVIKEYRIETNNYYFNLNIKLTPVADIRNKYNRIALKWQPTLGPKNISDKYDNLVTAYYTEDVKDVKYKNDNKMVIKREPGMKWITFHNRYFVASIMPVERYKISETFFYSGNKKNIAGIVSLIDPEKLKKQGMEYNYTIYAGPKLKDTFERIPQLSALKKTISTSSFPLIGKFTNKLGYLFLDLLIYINSIVKSYGIAIIIFTVLIKIVLYPLTHKQFVSMAKMQKIQPVITQVREQYKKDPQMMNKELMKVYKKYKVNPFGGCLPLLLQMPILLAMWNMLQFAIELRSASFLWIQSLALPDTVGYLGPIAINILPILMAVTMLFQQTGATDPKQKSMTYIMTFVFLIFFWNLPSGVVLYFTIQNILSSGQQYLIKKYQKIDVGGKTDENNRKNS